MIEIYGKDSCPWCDRAKNLCDSYGLKYIYKNVSLDEKLKKELLSKKPDTKTVPQIWWYGEHIGGYEDLAKAFEDRNISDCGNGTL